MGALVAETGSALSHLAILAREYRVPTVVGVVGATSRFHDGQLVTVDGSAGTVDVITVDAGKNDAGEIDAGGCNETPAEQPTTVGAPS